MPSRRALLGAALALPIACAASPRPPPHRRPPDPTRHPNAAQPFVVTKNDRASPLPNRSESGRSGRHDDEGEARREGRGDVQHPDSGNGQHADSSGEAQSSAVTKWDRALAQFRRAERIVKAAEGEPDEDLYDLLLGRFNNTLRRLLRIPAPHLPALAAKLAAANRHVAWELTGAEACIAALARDARRLALQPN